MTPQRTRGGYRLFGEEELDAAGDDPPAAARRVPAAEGDPRGAREADLARTAAPAGARARRGGGGARPGIALRARRHRPEARARARGVRPARAACRRAASASTARPTAEIAAICGRLAGFGIAPRHLRTFRTSTDRETGLLEAAIAPALRSRNPERQQQGTRDLQVLGELAQDLSQRLFWRSLRNLVS